METDSRPYMDGSYGQKRLDQYKAHREFFGTMQDLG